MISGERDYDLDMREVSWTRDQPAGDHTDLGSPLALAFTGAVTLGATALLAVVVATGTLDDVDSAILDAVTAHRTPWLESLAHVLAALGGSLGAVLVALAIGCVLASARRWVGAGALVVSVLVTWLGQEGAKALVGRERPTGGLAEIANAAYPSGHAASPRRSQQALLSRSVALGGCGSSGRSGLSRWRDHGSSSECTGRRMS